MQSLEKQVKNRFNISDLIKKLLNRVLKLEQGGGSGGGGVTLPIGIPDVTNLQTSLNNKQDTLVSGTNIKTINSGTLLGSGNLNLIPLSGTTVGNPLTGDIEINALSSIGLFKTTTTAQNSIRFVSNNIQVISKKATSTSVDISVLNMSQTSIALRTSGVTAAIKTEIIMLPANITLKAGTGNNITFHETNGVSVDLFNPLNGGIWSSAGLDYSTNAIPTSFMQKAYIDNGPILYSTAEILTRGTWVDNKPIYRFVKLTAASDPAGIETTILSRVAGSYTILEYTKI